MQTHTNRWQYHPKRMNLTKAMCKNLGKCGCHLGYSNVQLFEFDQCRKIFCMCKLSCDCFNCKLLVKTVFLTLKLK